MPNAAQLVVLARYASSDSPAKSTCMSMTIDCWQKRQFWKLACCNHALPFKSAPAACKCSHMVSVRTLSFHPMQPNLFHADGGGGVVQGHGGAGARAAGEQHLPRAAIQRAAQPRGGAAPCFALTHTCLFASLASALAGACCICIFPETCGPGPHGALCGTCTTCSRRS